MKKKIKLTFVAYYPAFYLKDKLVLDNFSLMHPTTWVVNLSNAISKIDDIELSIVSDACNISYDQYIFHNNIHFYFVKTPKKYNLSFNYYLSRRRIVKRIKQINPDLIHAHGFEGSIGLSAIDSGYPFLLSVQGIFNEYLKSEKKLTGKPDIRQALQAVIENKIAKKTKYFGTRTNFDTDFIKKKNKNAVIYYAPEIMNEVYFKVKPDLDSNNIVFIGTLNERKDPITLIRAFKIVKEKFSDIKLNMIGTGNDDYTGKLKEVIKDLDLEKNVILHYYKTPDEIASIFQNSSLLVLPTMIDNSPNAIAEAMSAGLPVIASNTGGIGSMIEDGENGYLSNPKDVNKFAELIIKVLENDELKLLFSRNNKKKSLAKYSEEYVTKIMYNNYLDILKREKSL